MVESPGAPDPRPDLWKDGSHGRQDDPRAGPRLPHGGDEDGQAGHRRRLRSAARRAHLVRAGRRRRRLHDGGAFGEGPEPAAQPPGRDGRRRRAPALRLRPGEGGPSSATRATCSTGRPGSAPATWVRNGRGSSGAATPRPTSSWSASGSSGWWRSPGSRTECSARRVGRAAQETGRGRGRPSLFQAPAVRFPPGGLLRAVRRWRLGLTASYGARVSGPLRRDDVRVTKALRRVVRRRGPRSAATASRV